MAEGEREKAGLRIGIMKANQKGSGLGETKKGKKEYIDMITARWNGLKKKTAGGI